VLLAPEGFAVAFWIVLLGACGLLIRISLTSSVNQAPDRGAN
jgi:hypothetical protein